MAEQIDMPLSCKECDYTTHRERKLARHVRKVHQKTFLKCPFCNTKGAYYTTPAELSAHKKKEHKGVRLRCFLCEFTSTKLTRWVKHFKGHQEVDIGCLVKSLSHKNNFLPQHEANVTVTESSFTHNVGSTVSISDSEQNLIDLTKCDAEILNAQCQDILLISSEDEMTSCVNIISDEENTTLARCSKVSTSDIHNPKDKIGDRETVRVSNIAVNLDNELEDAHGEANSTTLMSDTRMLLKNAEEIVPSVTKPYKGSLCDKSYKSKQALKKHQTIIHEKNLEFYPCKHCFRIYRTKNGLYQHVEQRHSEAPRFVCSFCGYISLNSADLKIHLRKHTGEKPFACHICEFKTARKGTLVQHIRYHTGEKPYQCTFCDYASETKKDLQAHIRIHTGVKPYSCSNCERGFSRKTNLNRHIKRGLCLS